MRELRGNSTSSWQTSQKVWRKLGWRDWIIRLRHSFSFTLSSQVNVRSSILGSSGSEKEAQRDFLVLVENAIRKLDIWKSVQKFQRTIDEAQVCLDLAVSTGIWLMPSNLLPNTQSMAGYNNSMKKGSSDMKVGINQSIFFTSNMPLVRETVRRHEIPTSLKWRWLLKE